MRDDAEKKSNGDGGKVLVMMMMIKSWYINYDVDSDVISFLKKIHSHHQYPPISNIVFVEIVVKIMIGQK